MLPRDRASFYSLFRLFSFVKVQDSVNYAVLRESGRCSVAFVVRSPPFTTLYSHHTFRKGDDPNSRRSLWPHPPTGSSFPSDVVQKGHGSG